ncbi:hypothetical protein BDN72DRAFT_617885 [Pluteus cervinus]|uniref:Uncharacterized protein n=1 Tax=Pluteus cervinus TaxID=181527 RepID=A0ACD3AWD3_9AGAR|nr:hypothetical protein BDN72DRAFT_617885 [Pluteus cervinus]
MATDSRSELPPEVWSRVFEYTCMDDGTIGRSLSLVSNLFYHASAPYKFQSIAVKPGHLKYIVKFLEVLQKATPIQRRVRYLFLGNNGILPSNGSSTESEDDPRDGYSSSDTEDSWDDDDSDVDDEATDLGWDSDTEWAPITEEDLQDLLEDAEYFTSPEAAEYLSLVPESIETMEDINRLDVLMLDVIHAILELCSESILSLSVSVKNFDECRGGYAPIFPNVRLPLLKELTWIIPIPDGRRALHYKRDRNPPPPGQRILFPSLTRFHVAFPIDEVNRLWIELCCPNLRYLRTEFQEELLGSAVQMALNNSTGEGTRSSSPGGPVQISMHTPSSVKLHLIDVCLQDTWLGGYTVETYCDIWREFELGRKYDLEKRVVLSAQRRDNWRMTERDWKKRKLGKLGRVGFRWKQCPSYEKWLREANSESSSEYDE